MQRARPDFSRLFSGVFHVAVASDLLWSQWCGRHH